MFKTLLKAEAFLLIFIYISDIYLYYFNNYL